MGFPGNLLIRMKNISGIEQSELFFEKEKWQFNDMPEYLNYDYDVCLKLS